MIASPAGRNVKCCTSLSATHCNTVWGLNLSGCSECFLFYLEGFSCLLFVHFGALRFALPRRQRIPLYWMSLAAVQVAATAKPAQLFASCDANVRSAPALLNVAGSFRGGQQQSAATSARRMRPRGNPKLDTSACEGVWVHVCVCVCAGIPWINIHAFMKRPKSGSSSWQLAGGCYVVTHTQSHTHTILHIMCRPPSSGTRCTIFILG